MDQVDDMNQTQEIGIETDLAIIGMAGRFPGSRNIIEFWNNLKNGIESISFFSDEEVLEAGVDPKYINDPHYVKAGGILDDVDLFDAGFFGIYPQEAAILDPQHRVFLETSWEALENAGYALDDFPGWIGVFAGTGMNTYLLFNLITNRDVIENVHGYQLTISNDKDFLPTRVSYKLNLRGPSVNVQTACSTSLVAIHLACQSLLDYQSDMALAGGVSIRFPQKQGYHYQEGGIGSPDGHCRAFDSDARGTVGGNGAGVVVIKRLNDALNDRDNILAVIKGSAINNDGSLKVGYTAPSVNGQSEVIATAQMLANVDPGTITYIETHGTGTELGDPIEITALNKVFKSKTSRTGYCAIGSVKTNVGHLDAAAGVTSVIKTVLALQHRQIPPSINFNNPNPRIDFHNSPFFVNTELRDWDAGGGPLRAGVSSFGIGGTNAHVVLEEAPQSQASGVSRDWKLILLSGETPEALDVQTKNLVSHINEIPEINLADVAYTLSVGRKRFSNRRFIVARDILDLSDGLRAQDPNRVFSSVNSTKISEHSRSVVFMFTGQGAQYVDMARDLYDAEPIFKFQIDLCAELLEPYLERDIRELIYPDLYGKDQIIDAGSASELLRQTSITQPALFVIEYALAILLNEFGVDPAAMIGHSIGEYVAACLSGVFSLEDALRLVVERGRLMQSLPPGSMISVPLSEKETRILLEESENNLAGLSIAVVNAPELCVVSGAPPLIDLFVAELDDKEIDYRQLHTSHAFHSPMMEPILDEFAQVVSSVKLAEPKIPFISNVSGSWITSQEATDPIYWVNHIRQTVRFSKGIETLLEDPSWIFIEIGPGSTLTTLTRSTMLSFSREMPALADGASRVIQSLRHPRVEISDVAFLLNALGKLWLAGAEINWNMFYSGEFRRRIPLPTYPFQRESYWIDPDHSLRGMVSEKADVRHKTIEKNMDIGSWFYVPSWKRLGIHNHQSHLETGKYWLIFLDPNTRDVFGREIRERLNKFQQNIVIVESGDEFKVLDEDQFMINPQIPEDYITLVEALVSSRRIPQYVIHALSLSIDQEHDTDVNNNPLLFTGYYSLLYFIQALNRKSISEDVQIGVLTNGVQEVLGTERQNPMQAPIVGLCRVISQEYLNIICRNIDLSSECLEADDLIPTIEKIILEMIANPEDRMIAYRGQYRWVEGAEQIKTADRKDYTPANLRDNGVYLITGGLGRIGLTFAKHLAERVRAKIALVDRSELPAGKTPAEWDNWVSKQADSAQLSNQIYQLKAIIAAGGEVQIYKADVSDSEQMSGVVQDIESKFGNIDGVIHAAGIVGEKAIKPIIETGFELSEIQFNPKIHGTLTLAKVFESKTLDFIFLQSSLSSVLGGLGMAAYASANFFMDVFASSQNRNGGTPWISVDWDGWMFAGQQEQVRTRTELTMDSEEGVEVFDRLMATGLNPRVIISTADLTERINRWIKNSQEIDTIEQEMDDRQESKSISGYQRPDLQTPYVPPRNELEDSIVQTWQKVLGIEPIGINDDFFELGGHSLLATQLASRLRDTFNVQLPLRRLFESATVAGVSAILQEAGIMPGEEWLSTDQLAQSEGIDKPIIPVSRDGDLQLSYGQQRLWFLDQMEPASPLYNNFSAIKFSGDLNIEALQFSMKRIVDRHEILRTTFHDKGGRPIQLVHEDMVVPLTMIDLRDLDPQDADKEFNELALTEARKPFYLDQGPMLRTSLIRLKDLEFIVLLTMHHIISDGWSVRVLIEEVAAFYSAYLNLEPAKINSFYLDDLPIQYVDFAHWQRGWLKNEVLNQQLDYWREQLADRDGNTGNVEIYPDYPRPAFQTSNGASIWFEVPAGLTAKLVSLSKKTGVTLFMLLMAALKTLIFRYTGQVDISIGTPIANRTRIETETLIGFILNTLVMRTDLSENPSFEDLLRREREVALGAYANQDVPFEMVVEALQPERDLSRAPFFQIIFDLQESPLPDLTLPGLEIAPLRVDSGTAKFDLALSMEMHTDGQTTDKLTGFFNYNIDLFTEQTIYRLLDHWIRLIENAVENPAKRITELEILSNAEKQTLLANWSQRGKSKILKEFVQDQFSRQALRTPTAIAITEVFGIFAYGQTLSYMELEQRSNQLAQYLIKLGVGPDKLVGVSMRRSIDMIVALLGVLKAGGAFLPLDPTYPVGRVAYMLTDSDVDILLTQERLLENLPNQISSTKKIHRLCLDRDWDEIAQQDVNNPESSISPSNLAYVIYTSGSTGLPKGVMVTHNDFVNHIYAIGEHFEISDSDRILQFASLNFDAALEQIFTSLTAGANLFIRGEEIWPTEEFNRIVQKLDLTVVNIPPVYWHHWSKYLAEQHKEDKGRRNNIFKSLRLVIIGGDVMQKESLALWHKSSPRSVRLLNAYGPTETTITSLTYEVIPYAGKDASDRTYRIPIGHPTVNRFVFILDNAGHPVPPGVPGELCIGGMGIARGYLNNPSLTAERFIPNQFGEYLSVDGLPAEWMNKLYRTGDLVRYLAEGEIEFLGRIDDQVKVRGFRIEIGEIETVIQRHPLISECAVILRTRGTDQHREPDQQVDKQLVAYVVPVEGNEPSSSELFDHIRDYLPNYMVPAAIIFLENLPISPSGKIDRRALPEPEATRPELEVAFIAPRTPVENDLARLWAEALDLEWKDGQSPIGVHDNFFELGGHSLLATQIISRVRETYQVDLPIRKVFETPTIEGLAEILSQSLLDSAETEEMDELLRTLESMSDEEAFALLNEDSIDPEVIDE